MSRFWEIVFCITLIFSPPCFFVYLKRAPSRELPLTTYSTVFRHLKSLHFVYLSIEIFHVLKTLAKLRILTYIIPYDFRLVGDASYQTNGGIKSLHLDGISGYAEIPAINFRKSSFSIALRFNVHDSYNQGHLISDWSSPWQFRLYVRYRKVQVQLRRSGVAQDLLHMASNRLVKKRSHDFLHGFFSTCCWIQGSEE